MNIIFYILQTYTNDDKTSQMEKYIKILMVNFWLSGQYLHVQYVRKKTMIARSMNTILLCKNHALTWISNFRPLNSFTHFTARWYIYIVNTLFYINRKSWTHSNSTQFNPDVWTLIITELYSTLPCIVNAQLYPNQINQLNSIP